MAASVSSRKRGLLGADAVDASGITHAGLPWAGCTILTASAEQLTAIRDKATASEAVLVADMPDQAQLTRVYDEYLAAVADIPSDNLEYYAVSLMGPRNRVDRLVNRLPLMP